MFNSWHTEESFALKNKVPNGCERIGVENEETADCWTFVQETDPWDLTPDQLLFDSAFGYCLKGSAELHLNNKKRERQSIIFRNKYTDNVAECLLTHFID